MLAFADAWMERMAVLSSRTGPAGLLIFTVLVAFAPLVAAAERPPNVVILFADDLGYGDLGSYGHPSIRTPNLDRLAAAGQRWTDFYVAAPVCSPSRGALLTGRYPVRTGLYGRQINVYFPDDPGGLPETQVTLAERLQQAGYATAIIGKWHLGDAPAALPTRHGFDYWYGLPYSNDMDWADGIAFEEVVAMRAAGRLEDIQSLYAARRTRYFEPRVEFWNVPLFESIGNGAVAEDRIVERPVDQTTLTRRSTEAALRFLEDHQAEPFFLYVPYSMPHTPIFRSAAFEDQSLGGRYGDVIEELDWSVGQIVGKLEALELAEDTLVIFSSDNGPWLTMNQHGGSAGMLKQGKGTTFEGGMRVPMIASFPGRIEPGVVSGIGSTLDLFATVTALAGLSDSETDGHDLGPALFAGAPSPRQELAYYASGELRAYRKGPYKLHLITQGAYGQSPPRTEHDTPLLFHLGEDPGERFDIAATHPDIVAELQAAIARHIRTVPVAEPLFDRRLAALQTGRD